MASTTIRTACFSAAGRFPGRRRPGGRSSKPTAGAPSGSPIWIFTHGLGDYGACEIISVEGADGAGAERAALWYGDDVRSPERNDSLSAVVTGTMENGFNGIAQKTEVTTVALEYGTKPVYEVLEALRADTWLHLHGDPASEEGRAIKRQIRDAFYGDEPEWKRMIWNKAVRVVRQAAAGLAG